MILVVDGNNLGHRVFHTPQANLTLKDGTPSGVIIGIVKAIKGLLEKFPETSKVIVAWDTKGGSDWRKKLYPDYKGNRDYGKDDEEKKKAYQGLWMQMDESHNSLHLLGINSIKVSGFEADDIISEICKASKDHVMIVTSDKDMLQLVSEKVSVYSPYRDIVYSPGNFFDEIGITREAYIGYRALVGDKSDNILGINGIAEGKAKKLMDEYGHIDNILNAQGDNKKKLMKSKVFSRIFEPEGLNRLAINNKIMNFRFVPQDDKVAEEINNALYGPALEFNSKEFKQWCIKWQYVSILTNYMPFVTPFMALGDE